MVNKQYANLFDLVNFTAASIGRSYVCFLVFQKWVIVGTHSRAVRLKSAKPLKPLLRVKRHKVKSNPSTCLQVFLYSAKTILLIFFFPLWNWVFFFFSLQKYSYHNVSWWAAALWTQPCRNPSWAAAAKVWAHPFFIPFTSVNGVNSKPAMTILHMQSVVVIVSFWNWNQ